RRERERRSIDPMEILNREHDRLCLRGARQPTAERIVEAAAETLRLEVGHAIAVVDREPEEAGEEGQRVVSRYTCEVRLEALPRGRWRFVDPRFSKVAKQLGIRPVRHCSPIR